MSEVGKRGEPRAWHTLHSDHWAICEHSGTAGRAPELPQEPAGRAGRWQGGELSPRPGADWGRVAMSHRSRVGAAQGEASHRVHPFSLQHSAGLQLSLGVHGAVQDLLCGESILPLAVCPPPVAVPAPSLRQAALRGRQRAAMCVMCQAVCAQRLFTWEGGDGGREGGKRRL